MVHSTRTRIVRYAVFGVAATLISGPAQAAFHLWNIREIFTDASGSLQFIELFCTSSGQNVEGAPRPGVKTGVTRTV